VAELEERMEEEMDRIKDKDIEGYQVQYMTGREVEMEGIKDNNIEKDQRRAKGRAAPRFFAF
jgi:hypothetical protein